jgi:cell division protein FtsX
MTDRVDSFVVVLDRDYRTDDVEAIQKAIRMVKGVKSVIKQVSDLRDAVARARVRNELMMKLLDVLKEES